MSNIPNQLRYDVSFDRLLHFYFAVGLYHDMRTYNNLAKDIGVSRRTLNGWFAGEHKPQSPELVLRLAKQLGLMRLETDLLLYSINPSWIHYDTPIDILESFSLLHYQERLVMGHPAPIHTPPTIPEIEHLWDITLRDSFENNYFGWGLGYKDDGISRIDREMKDGQFVLTSTNRFHDAVFMGADSACFAPPVYYVTVYAQLVQGSDDNDGYALHFEEISDNCLAIFRIRDRSQIVSIIQTMNGGGVFNIHLDRTHVAAIRPGESNKLTILAIHNEHWFYINDMLIGQRNIQRLSYSRLDIGIVASGRQTVQCIFRDFCVRVPPVTQRFPQLAELLSEATQ